MPRTARAAVAGQIYHVLNRGNNRARVFLDEPDYAFFLKLLARACAKHPVHLIAVCLMPNHYHFVVEPQTDDALASWVHWIMTCHAARFHRRNGSSGRIWEGRFKDFPVQNDEHLLTVMRYVERNACKAGLVQRAAQWPWGSLAWRTGAYAGIPLVEPPLALPPNWEATVDAAAGGSAYADFQKSIDRGMPYGEPDWTQRTAQKLGLEHTLRGRGRPRNTSS